MILHVLLSVVFLLSQYILAQNALDQFGCPKTFRLNSIGEEVMNNENYIKIAEKRKYFILYATATWCDYCCQTELQLFELRKLLHGRKFDGHEISFVQIYTDKTMEPLKEYKLSLFKIPTIYFVKDKQFYQYGGMIDSDNIFRFINNILHPVVELHSVEDVERFMNTSMNYQYDSDFLNSYDLNLKPEIDFHLRNRIVGFFSDIDEYSAEYSTFLSVAEKISYRYDLRIGIVTNRDLIAHFKLVYEGIWFNSHSWNSIVVKRNQKYYHLDLSLLSQHLENFMVYNTMCSIDEISMNNNALLTRIKTPLVFFFIDASFNLHDFHGAMKTFMDLSEKYLGYYVLLYMDGNTKTKAKEVFGLKKESEIPTMVIQYLATGKQKFYPEDTEFKLDKIKEFLDENTAGNIVSEMDQLKEKQAKSYDDKIVRLLKLATKTDKTNFKTIVNNKKYDVALIIVDTDYDYYSEKVAKFFNRANERFKTLGIKSVLFATYDLNENGPLENERITSEKGQIFLFPAHSKKPIEFKDNLTVLRLMKWLEHESEIKFRLPEIPHIDLELHEEYYKKKTVLESYDENSNKNDYEIDDMIAMDFSKLELDNKKVDL